MGSLEHRCVAPAALSASLLVAAEVGRHGPGPVASVMIVGAALVVFAILRAFGLTWTYRGTVVVSAWVFASAWMLTLVPGLLPTVLTGLATCAIVTVMVVKATPRFVLRDRYR